MPSGKILASALLALATACPVADRESGLWTLVGTARMEGDTVFLTEYEGGTGTAWSTERIDATSSFRMRFACWFGQGDSRGRSSLLFAEDLPASPDQGTDALAGIEVRTDGADPMEDSIAMIRCVAGCETRTTQVMPAGNLDNGLVHHLSLSWDASRGRLFVWLDGMEEPVLASFEPDFFSSLFPDPSDLGWGFSASPGIPGALRWIVPDQR